MSWSRPCLSRIRCPRRNSCRKAVSQPLHPRLPSPGTRLNRVEAVPESVMVDVVLATALAAAGCASTELG